MDGASKRGGGRRSRRAIRYRVAPVSLFTRDVYRLNMFAFAKNFLTDAAATRCWSVVGNVLEDFCFVHPGLDQSVGCRPDYWLFHLLVLHQFPSRQLLLQFTLIHE